MSAILWWPEVYRAFDLSVPVRVGVGVSGVVSGPADFGLEVPVGVGMSGTAISSGEFDLTVPVSLDMHGPVSADLSVPVSIGMAGSEEYSATTDLSVPVSIGATGVLSGGPFSLEVPVSIGATGELGGTGYDLPLYVTFGGAAPAGGLRRWTGTASVLMRSNLDAPLGVAADRDGNVYLAHGGVVSRFNGTAWETIITGLTSPYGVAVDPSGDVYVVHGNAVARWDRASGTRTNIITGLSSPRGVAVDDNGNVYVAEWNLNRVSRWDGTTKTTIMADLTGGAYGVAVDREGNVYVTQRNTGVVTRWDGTTQTDIITGLGVTHGVAVAGNGDIYVARSAGVVTRWRNGVQTNVLTGLSTPAYIALTPQEPDSPIVPAPWIEDDFNRPNSTTSLGEDWVVKAGSMGINGNAAYPTVANECSAMYLNPLGSDDMEVSIVVGDYTGDALTVGRPSYIILGANEQTGAAARLDVSRSSSNVFLDTASDWAYGGPTRRATIPHGGIATGDEFTLRRVGNVYTVLKNGNQIGQPWVDTGNALPRNANYRYVGIGGWGGSTTTSFQRIDHFTAQTL